jgi:hypothetical protein
LQSHPPPFELHFPSSSPPLSTTEPINAPFTPQMQPTTLHNSRIHPKPFIHPHPNPHPHQTQASTATTRTQQQQHPKNQPRRAPGSRRQTHNPPTHPAQPNQMITSSSVKPQQQQHARSNNNTPKTNPDAPQNRAEQSTTPQPIQPNHSRRSLPAASSLTPNPTSPDHEGHTGSAPADVPTAPGNPRTANTTGQLHLQRKSSNAFGAQQEAHPLPNDPTFPQEARSPPTKPEQDRQRSQQGSYIYSANLRTPSAPSRNAHLRHDQTLPPRGGALRGAPLIESHQVTKRPTSFRGSE